MQALEVAREPIYTSDGTSGDARYRGAITYDHNGDYMMMRTAGAEVMRIKSDGKVGIGINDPTDILHVYGSSETGSIRIGGANGSGNIEFILMLIPLHRT